jgi:hypothetical protein
MKRFRLLIPIVVAGTLGPLVGGLIFCALAVYANFFDQTADLPIADLFTMFGVYIIVAYLEGGVVALLAGLLVSIWMIWRPPGFVVAIAAALASVGLYRLAAEIGMLSPADATMVSDDLAPALAIAAMSAGVCWLLTGRFVRTT